MLFGQYRADEADQGVAVGEDADDIGAPADLLVEPFLGVVGPNLAPDLFGEGSELQQVLPGILEVFGDLGSLVDVLPAHRIAVDVGGSGPPHGPDA